MLPPIKTGWFDDIGQFSVRTGPCMSEILPSSEYFLQKEETEPKLLILNSIEKEVYGERRQHFR